MKVAILTLAQKESLIGQLVQPDWFYNPVQDCNGDWIITEQEINATSNPVFDWLKSLPLVDWCGSYTPPSSENYVGS